MISQEQLKEIEVRCEKATEGPWRDCGLDEFNVQYYADNVVCLLGEAGHIIFSSDPVGNPKGIGNVKFIAHSRSDIPLLLAEVKRLQRMSKSYDETLVKLAESQERNEKLESLAVTAQELVKARRNFADLSGAVHRLSLKLEALADLEEKC